MAYNPAVSYRGDAYLAQGLNNLGEGIAQAIASHKQNKADTQAADATFDLMLGMAKDVGYTPDDKTAATLGKFSGSGLSAKKAMLGQLAMSIAGHRQKQQDQQRAQMDALQMEAMKEQIATARQQRAGEEAYGQAVRGSVVGPTGPQPLNAQNIAAAIAANPAAAASRPGQNIIEQLARLAPEQTMPGLFTRQDIEKPLPTGYARIPLGPNSSQVVPVMPTGQTGPQTSPDGAFYYDGRTWKATPQSGFPEGSFVDVDNGVKVIRDPQGRILKTIGRNDPMAAYLEGILPANPPGATPSAAPPAARSAPTANTSTNLLNVGKYKVRY